MKKKFSAIASLVLCLTFALSGCQFFSDMTTSKNTTSQVTAVAQQKINVVKNAEELSGTEIPSAETKKAWQDQFGNKYYTFFLGKIELAEIYNLTSFYYSGEMSDVSISQETVNHQTVIESYQKTVSTTTAWSASNYVETSVGTSVGVMFAPFEAAVENSITTGFETTYGKNYTEENIEYFETITTKINKIKTEKTINCNKACTPGKFYRYSVCGDINCFMNLYVPADGSEATYNIYSQLVNPNYTFDMLLESDTHTGFYENKQFSLENINISNIPVTETVYSYPDLNFSSSIDTVYHNEPRRRTGNRFNLIGYENWIKWGYNKIEVNYELYAISNGAHIHGYLSASEAISDQVQSWEESTDYSGKWIRKTAIVDLSRFSKEQGFWIVFENENWIHDFTVKNLSVSVRIYKV